MIQRIQTVYLVVTLLLSVALFFLPLGEKIEAGADGIQARHELTISKVISVSGDATPQHTPTTLLLVLNLLIMAATAYTIFQYRNRPGQIRLCMITGMLAIVLLMMVFYYSEDMGVTEQRVHYLAGIYLIPVQIFMLLAARRAIIRDERLVRAADRIR
jgi:hypothetical protein